MRRRASRRMRALVREVWVSWRVAFRFWISVGGMWGLRLARSSRRLIWVVMVFWASSLAVSMGFLRARWATALAAVSMLGKSSLRKDSCERMRRGLAGWRREAGGALVWALPL